jgi:hypothetical protein
MVDPKPLLEPFRMAKEPPETVLPENTPIFDTPNSGTQGSNSTSKAESIHPFARPKPGAQPQQEQSAKNEKKKGKKCKGEKKLVTTEIRGPAVVASNMQATGMASTSMSSSNQGITTVLAESRDFSKKKDVGNENEEIANDIAPSTPSKGEGHAFIMSVSPSLVSCGFPLEQDQIKHDKGHTSLTPSSQPSTTFTKTQPASAKLPTKVVEPALPRLVNKQTAYSTKSSMYRHSDQESSAVAIPDIHAVNDTTSNTSSPMSARTAKEYQTPDPCPMPGSSSSPALVSTSDDYGDRSGTETIAQPVSSSDTQVIADSGAHPPVQTKKKKNKKKSKKPKSNAAIDNSQGDGNSSKKTDDAKVDEADEAETVFKSGEIKDQQQEPSCLNPQQGGVTDAGNSFESDVEVKQFSMSQDGAAGKHSTLKENVPTKPDSWANVASRIQSANPDSTKQQGLTNRSPNLPGTTSSLALSGHKG